MAKQERIQKKATEQKTEQVEEVQAVDTAKTEELKSELDELLESIDEALGENLEQALAFTSGFIQKGGE